MSKTPTLELVRAGTTPRHYLTCRDTENIAPVECDSTSFEIHFFKDQAVEIVCSACGASYTIGEVMMMANYFPED